VQEINILTAQKNPSSRKTKNKRMFKRLTIKKSDGVEMRKRLERLMHLRSDLAERIRMKKRRMT